MTTSDQDLHIDACLCRPAPLLNRAPDRAVFHLMAPSNLAEQILGPIGVLGFVYGVAYCVKRRGRPAEDRNRGEHQLASLTDVTTNVNGSAQGGGRGSSIRNTPTAAGARSASQARSVSSYAKHEQHDRDLRLLQLAAVTPHDSHCWVRDGDLRRLGGSQTRNISLTHLFVALKSD